MAERKEGWGSCQSGDRRRTALQDLVASLGTGEMLDLSPGDRHCDDAMNEERERPKETPSASVIISTTLGGEIVRFNVAVVDKVSGWICPWSAVLWLSSCKNGGRHQNGARR